MQAQQEMGTWPARAFSAVVAADCMSCKNCDTLGLFTDAGPKALCGGVVDFMCEMEYTFVAQLTKCKPEFTR